MNSRDLLAQLVRFDTTSRESNLALIDFVRTYLQGHGVACELVFNAQKSKANLLATLGPAGVPGIVLSGHTDVVPVDGQRWTVAPFDLTEKDGKLYGRGTADMKGYIACVLACVPALVQAPLRMPVHIALSYDEEVGCLGVRSLIERFHAQPVKPLLCVIGEPTELKPVLGHKGKLGMRCQIHGAACHSAYAPSGVNAIEYAARLISELVRLGETLKAEQHLDARFDPPFSTVQTGVISGGKALNIVPQDCSFDFEELRGGRMRLHGTGHGDGVLVVGEAVVRFVLDAWALVFLFFHARLETAALDHEVTDDTVENGVFVVACVHVLDEVGDGDRRFLGVQLDDDVTVVGGQFDLSHVHYSFQGIRGFGRQGAATGLAKCVPRRAV